MIPGVFQNLEIGAHSLPQPSACCARARARHPVPHLPCLTPRSTHSRSALARTDARRPDAHEAAPAPTRARGCDAPLSPTRRLGPAPGPAALPGALHLTSTAHLTRSHLDASSRAMSASGQSHRAPLACRREHMHADARDGRCRVAFCMRRSPRITHRQSRASPARCITPVHSLADSTRAQGIAYGPHRSRVPRPRVYRSGLVMTHSYSRTPRAAGPSDPRNGPT